MSSIERIHQNPGLKEKCSSKNLLPSNENQEELPQFDWKNKWLKGEEYAHILNHVEDYSETYKMPKLAHKTHPASIYNEPENGMIYFVEGGSVGSDFGFPRVEMKKKYRWKKMNFTTDLPKGRPCVTYIVASAVKCEKFFPDSKNEGPSFRMHAVMLNKSGDQTDKKIEDANLPFETLLLRRNSTNSEEKIKEGSKHYILCHIRKIESNAYKGVQSTKEIDEKSEEIEIEDKETSEIEKISKKFITERKSGQSSFSTVSRSNEKENSSQFLNVTVPKSDERLINPFEKPQAKSSVYHPSRIFEESNIKINGKNPQTKELTEIPVKRKSTIIETTQLPEISNFDYFKLFNLMVYKKNSSP